MNYNSYNDCLLKSRNKWACVVDGEVFRFNWKIQILEKAEKGKKYYSSDEIKARGMRWVTIRGARVLLQGTSDGGWVVVGGAGGKLNHYKVDRLLGKEDYKKRVEARKQNEKEVTKDLSEADKKKRTREAGELKDIQKLAKKKYRDKVEKILEDTSITKKPPTKLLEEAVEKQIKEEAIATVMEKQGVTEEDIKKDEKLQKKVEKEADKKTEQERTKKVREKINEAREALATNFLEGETNPSADTDVEKTMMTEETALELLKAEAQLKKVLKTVKRGERDNEARLKVGEAFAGVLPDNVTEIKEQIANSVETAENIDLYDRVNTKGDKIQKHIDIGASRALNGVLSSIYGQGAMFDASMVTELGIEAMTRAIANKLEIDGKADMAHEALTKYSDKVRRDTVANAMKEADNALDKSKAMFSLANNEDGLAIFNKAVANGKSARFYTKSSAELGGAVGSLRSMAHIINALEDPPNKTIQVDCGRDFEKAKRKMVRAGLDEDMYNLKKDRYGRFVAEIDADHLTPIFDKSAEALARDKKLADIKLHKANTGKVADGIQEGFGWMGGAQEAGYRFAKERNKVLLDFKPGLGKTFIAGNAIADGLKNGMKKILVTVPATLKDQFEEEMIDHYVIGKGGEKELKKGFLAPELQAMITKAGEKVDPADRRALLEKNGVHIVSHTALQNDKDFIHAQKWDMIIADEVHALVNAKKGDANSKSYESLAKLSEGTGRLIAMTGTPIKTHKREMYKLGRLVDPEHTKNALGTMDEFEKRHLDINQTTSAFSNAECEAFRSEISELSYSQDNKIDVKHTKVTTDVKINNDQKRALKQLQIDYDEKMIQADRPIDPKTGKQVKKKNEAGWRDSEAWRISNLLGGRQNPKFRAVVADIRQNHEDKRGLLFFSQGTSVEGSKIYAEQMNAEFGEGSAVAVSSKTTSTQLDKLKQRINAKDPNDPLKYLVGTTTLATGHNIQGAEFIHHIDVPLSKAQAEQQEARAYRKGQTSDVTTTSFYSNDPNDINKRNNFETKGKESDIVGNPASVSGLTEGGFGSYVEEVQRQRREAI